MFPMKNNKKKKKIKEESKKGKTVQTDNKIIWLLKSKQYIWLRESNIDVLYTKIGNM